MSEIDQAIRDELAAGNPLGTLAHDDECPGDCGRSNGIPNCR